MGAAAARAPQQIQQLVAQLKTAVQSIVAFRQAIQGVKPEAAQDFSQALQFISSGISKLRGQGPSQAPGAVPAPAPQVAATPEAT